MKEKQFEKLVEIAKKRLLEDKKENTGIIYQLKISGYSDEDAELIVGKAVKDLTGHSPTLNYLVCLFTASLYEAKNSTKEDFSVIDINLAFESAKLLFYEKAKNSTEAIIKTKKKKEE